jgi:site-specific recombinase XerD
MVERKGIEPSTVRRDLDTLASVLTLAMKLGHLTENVVRRVERPRIDRSPKVRYLSREEESRLRELLGHGSLATTLRYAHLAPDQKREAVARLVQP